VVVDYPRGGRCNYRNDCDHDKHETEELLDNIEQ